MVDEFNQTNEWGIHVIMSAPGSAAMVTSKTLEGIANKQPPNVLAAAPGFILAVDERDALVLDLTSYIDSVGYGLTANEVADFKPLFWEELMVNEKRIGIPARVGHRKLDYAAPLDTHGVPVVALAGTCMEAGKTAAACAIVSRMRHRGLAVHAFKATGVSLRRDILAMEDSGARRSMIFTDLGIVTTTAASGPALTRTMLTEMTQGRPDVVVFELGDGILGAYGVEAILQEQDIRQSLTAVILSANDPVAAWGGVKLLRERFLIEPCAVTGPATDNAVGVKIIEEQMGVRAVNAMAAGAVLGDHIIESLGLNAQLARAAAE